MSDEIRVISFGTELWIQMQIEGKEFSKATVRFTLLEKGGIVLEEGETIPINRLFFITELIDISIKHRTAFLEKELQRMKGEGNGKEN